MEFRSNNEKNATLLNSHTLLPKGIILSVFPLQFFNCGCTCLHRSAPYFHPWCTQGEKTQQSRGFATT